MNCFKYILKGSLGYENWFFIMYRNACKYLCFGDRPKNIKLHMRMHMHVSVYTPTTIAPFTLL